MFRCDKILGPKKFEFHKNKISGLKTLAIIKFWVWKKFSFQKNLALKKFCPRTVWPTKIITPKKLGPKSLVKIGPVTVEILLIWTNVTRANVAWTYVSKAIGIF